jgi:hypothetical protein
MPVACSFRLAAVEVTRIGLGTNRLTDSSAGQAAGAG